LHSHSAADTGHYLAIAADIANDASQALTYPVDLRAALPCTLRSKVNVRFARRTSVA
jgi:hypothetical protein